MSLTITISTSPDYGRSTDQVDDALAALGWHRGPQLAPPFTGEAAPVPQPAEAAAAPAASEEPKGSRGRPRKGDKAAEQPNISANPENRTDPAAGEQDDAATAAQDKADEKAEVDAHRDAKAPLTLEDVKSAVGAYVAAYGMAATQEDGPAIFVEALGKPPEGESFWRMSILPDDQEKLQKVIDTWAKATELNPLKRAKAS